MFLKRDLNIANPPDLNVLISDLQTEIKDDVGKLPFMLELIVIPSQQNWDILLGLDFLEDTETSIIHSRAGNNLMMWNGSVVKAISDEDISLNTKDFPFPSQAIKWFKEQLLKQ